MSSFAPETISEWTPTILTKFIRDLLNNNPPDFLPNLNAENITATVKLRVKDSMEYTKEVRFRPIGGTGQPAFQNSWVNFNTTPGWQVAGFHKDPLGFVRLRGLIKSGTASSVAFTLPPGHRPLSGGEVFPVAAGTPAAVGDRIEVAASGTVTVIVTNNAYVSLSGIAFRTS